MRGGNEIAGETGPTFTPTKGGSYRCRVTASNLAGSSLQTSAPVTVDTTPPETTITSGPSGATNDPTPSFSFDSSESGSTFQCKVDSGAYSACSSSETVAHLGDGSHTFAVRAKDSGGNVDPTPASHSFTVRTAAISIQGTHLLIVAAAGASDNLAITSPSDSVLRVTDSPSGAYAGSGVHGWNGCSRSSDETADCNAAGITLIQVFSGDQEAVGWSTRL